jgi:hypothetical protein
MFCAFRAFRSHKDKVCGGGRIPHSTLYSIAFDSERCRFYKLKHRFSFKDKGATYYAANKYLAA